MKPRLLLHICCGPCSTHCIKDLMQEYDVTGFFYNPNIHPYHEYSSRLEAAEKVCEKLNIPLIEADYDPENWIEDIKGFEEEPEGGKRCSICFNTRLARTAKFAKDDGFECFTTTMTISPHKDARRINGTGEFQATKHGVTWLHSDFKKKDGFRRSTEAGKKMGLYRQDYCGCFYSLSDRKRRAD